MPSFSYLKAFRRSWMLILAITILGAISATGFSLTQRPTYQTSATVFVSTSSTTSVTDLSVGTSFIQEAVKTYAIVATSPYVLRSVSTKLSNQVSTQALASQVTASAADQTAIITITVTNSNPALAADIANLTSTELDAAVTKLTSQNVASSPTVKITPIQPAAVPTSPVSPKLAVNILVGTLGGFVLALLFALLTELFNTSVRGVDDIRLATAVPILGTIGFDPEAGERPLIVRELAHSARAESFRTLRTNLQFLDLPKSSHVYVVTSSIDSEGKSTSAANLAIALSEAGRSVVLVDGDLRRPQIASYLALDGSLGLTDALIGRLPLSDVLQTWGDAGLCVLPAGAIPPNPNELLQGDAMTSVIDQLRERFDTVLIDAPPVLPVSDATVLAKRASGALVICAVGRARRPQLQSVLATFGQLDIRVLGIVATMVPARGPDGYADRQYYYASDRP